MTQVQLERRTRNAESGGGACRGRVLLVAPQPFYEDRGTPIATRQLLKALSQLGYEVDVATFPIGADIELPGVRIFRGANPLGFDRVPIGFSARKLVLDAALLPLVAKRLRGGGYACIHAVEEAAFPAVVLGRIFGVPVLYDMQSSLPEQLAGRRPFGLRPVQRLLRASERWLLRRADFVASSAGLAARVQSCAPGTPVREWPYAGDASAPAAGVIAGLRRRHGISPAAPVIVYTGSFAPYQGLPELIGAIPAVHERAGDAVFVLVGGDAGADGGVRELASSMRLNGGLRVVPRVPRAQIRGYLAMADVLVSPRAYGRNLPLKIFDYLAAGRPIVASDLPVHRAVLDTNRALLVPHSPEGFAGAIIRLIDSPHLAAELAAGAAEYAAAHLGELAFTQMVAETYEQLCAAPAAGAHD